MERNVPKLRFKGFNDEWENKKLGEFLTFYSTNSFSRDCLNYENGDAQNIHYGDIHMKFPTILDTEKYNIPYINSDINISKYSEESFCKDGDLVIADASEDYADIGKSIEVCNIGNKKILAGLHTILARDNKLVTVNGFKGYMMQSESVRKQVKVLAAGAKVLGISKSNLEKVNVKLPSLQEQERISNFLTKVDKIIEKQDEKVRNLEKYKKGMMQKIFSQEIRFKDENGEEYPEWEIKRVEDVANIQVGFTPDTKNDSFWDGDIKWLSIAGMNSKYIFDGNKRISNEALGKRELIPKNTLVMSFKLTIGRLAIIKEPMITNEAICQFYWKNKNIINEYMYQYLDSIRIESFGCRAAKGITLNNESLNSIIVKLPCLDEQNKIADLLNNIDCIHQEELNKLNELKQWKKGLLQQMFV